MKWHLVQRNFESVALKMLATKVVIFSLLLGITWSQNCPTWTEWTDCCRPCTKSVNLIRSKKQLDCNGKMLQYRFDTCDQSWSDWSGCFGDGSEMRYRNACPDITETRPCKDKCECPDSYEPLPVCGSNGKTYQNECDLLLDKCQNKSESLFKEYDGECQKYRYEPIVLKGFVLPSIRSYEIDWIVGFSIQEGHWRQIPIQIDEMHYQSWDFIKNFSDCRLENRPIEPALVYADPETYSGPDEDPTFDTDDELVFMARHLGSRWTNIDPPENVLPDIVEVVEIFDNYGDWPPNIIGYIYLLISKLDSGSPILSPDAGYKLVDYQFNLTSRIYKEDYKFNCDMPANQDGTTNHDCLDPIMNPEDSWFKSGHYERHFKENWISDRVQILTGNSNGQNFWDIDEIQLLPYYCNRNMYTFTHGPTAFIANKVGPVRAIRSILGSNSGVLTQRNTFMYEQTEHQETIFKVHPLPGFLSYINFKTGIPLTYYNCHNKEGFDVNGQMEPNELNSNEDFCPWQMVNGHTGTFLRSIQLQESVSTDFYLLPNSDPGQFLKSWYIDNANPISTGSPWDISKFPFHNAPIYALPNFDDTLDTIFAMCSYFSNEQNEAWGTMGYRLKPEFQWKFDNQGNYLSGLGVPNNDPLGRYNSDDGVPCTLDGFPQEVLDPVYPITLKAKHYFLPPELDVKRAEELYEESIKPLNPTDFLAK